MMKKLLTTIFSLALAVALSGGYVATPAIAQINLASDISQETSDSIVNLMSRWNTALSETNSEALLQVYVPEDREYVQEIIRGRGRAIGTGVDVRAIERIGPDSYRVRFIRFWGGSKPGRSNVSVEIVQVGDKLLMKVPAAQKAVLAQRSTPAAVTPVPEPQKPKVAEISTPPTPEVSSPKIASEPPKAPAAAVTASSPPAPTSPSAATPVVVEPKAPKSPVAPLVVTTDTKARAAEPTRTTTAPAPIASGAAEAKTAPQAAPQAAPAVPAAPAATSSKARLGAGVDQQAAESLVALVDKWNDGIANVDAAALTAIHAPEDKEAVEKLVSTRAKSVDSKVSVNSIEKVAENTFRIRITRSWGGARGGKAANMLEAERRDGQYLLRINKAQVATAAKRSATSVAAPSAAPVNAAAADVKSEKTTEPSATQPAAPVVTATPTAVAPASSASQATPNKAEAVASKPAAPAKADASSSDKSAGAAAKKAPSRVASSSNTAKTGSKPTSMLDGSAPLLNTDGTVRYVFAKVGHATLVKLPIAATRVAVGDPNILDFTMINSKELYVLGKSVGTSNMILWDASGRSIVLPAAVNVDLEPLGASIRESLPQEQDVKISSIAGSIVLSGVISDGLAAKTALDLAGAFIANLNRQIEAAGKQQAGGGQGGQSVSALRVIDLMRLRDSQQVMLDVRIAEISKDLLEQLGVNINRTASAGNNIVYSILSGFPFGNSGTLPSGSLKFTSQNGTIVEVQAEKRDSLVKILAEPSIVAMSGQEGSFLAGGTVYLPAGVSSGGVPGQPLEKEYGVSLKFVPTVLDGGRINLRVSPEVSELAGVTPGTNYPAFLTRKVSTSVQLRSGQSLLIGGLLRNNVTEAVSAFPILGELPIIGALFRSSDYSAKKTELVVFVSPSVVKATETKPDNPTDNFSPPSRAEFFLQGSMEKR